MIKIGHFTFEELPSKDHWVDFAKFGTPLEYDVQFFDQPCDVTFQLKAGEVYQIGFDQSTSNTGCFIKNYKNTEAFMIEVSRRKGAEVDDYLFDLEMFLHGFCRDALVSHIIYERPIEIKDKRTHRVRFRSSQVLFQLEGIIRGLVKRYSEFKNAQLDCIENASWRQVVILPQYKNDGTPRKEDTALSIKDIFDWTHLYGFSLGGDYDIFEAMGVLFGWFLKSFDGLGRPYVRGDQYNGNIGGFILPNISAEETAKQLDTLGIETKWFVQNPNKSTYQNLACAVEKYKVVCVELNQCYSMLALSVECNLKWEDFDCMTVVLVAANYADARLFEITGKEYHFVF